MLGRTEGRFAAVAGNAFATFAMRIKLLAGLVLAVLLASSLPSEAATVAYWNFTTGAVLDDASGNGNGLSNAGVTFADEAAVFDGTHTVFNTTGPLNLTGTQQITVEYFMKTSQAGVGVVFEHTPNKNSFDGAFGSFINSPSVGDATGSYNPSPGNFDIPGALVNDGEFHHYALVIDQTISGGTLTDTEFFIDYASVGNTTLSDAANFLSNTFFIGSRGNSLLKFQGMLDDIRVSDTALAPSEFLQSRSATVPEPTSVALWLLLGLVTVAGFLWRRRAAR